jgi:Zn-finger nucleic acid-binding protein
MDGDSADDTALDCPVCGTTMEPRSLGDGEVNACPAGHGVFLRRADLGSLVEAEQDWHRHSGQHTMPMPRITADMTVPPGSRTRSRAWIETLFG